MLKIISGLLVVLVPVVCSAEVKGKQPLPRPDLSGAWVLDEASSTSSLRKKDRPTDYTITIVHREPEIRMEKRFKQGGRLVVGEVIYYTDGRPEYNSLLGVRDPEPVTRWRGGRLIRRSVKEAQGTYPVVLKIETVEEWVLSKDGKTLTRTVVSTGPGFSMKSKDVFNRLPSVALPFRPRSITRACTRPGSAQVSSVA